MLIVLCEVSDRATLSLLKLSESCLCGLSDELECLLAIIYKDVYFGFESSLVLCRGLGGSVKHRSIGVLKDRV